MLPIMATTVHESGYRQGTRAVVPEGKGQKFRVRLMGWDPGTKTVEGSSADYPVDVIRRDFAEAFPIGTRMRANHDGFCEAGGDIRRIMAKTISTPEAEADGMYADAIAKEGEASDFLRQYADVVGTSISAACEIEKVPAVDEDGEIIFDRNDEPVMVPKLSERGAQIVKRFLPMSESPYNACDFVEAPGADGAVVKLALESAKTIVEHAVLRESVGFAIGLAGSREKTSETNPSRIQEEGEISVDEKQLREALDGFKSSVVEAVRTELKPETTESKEPKLGAVVEAVVAAGLTEAGRGAVYERIENGESVETAIEKEKKRDESARAELLEKHGVKPAKAGSGFGFTVGENEGGIKGGGQREAAEINKSFDEMEVD